jgi:hypothetical protein
MSNLPITSIMSSIYSTMSDTLVTDYSAIKTVDIITTKVTTVSWCKQSSFFIVNSVT